MNDWRSTPREHAVPARRTLRVLDLFSGLGGWSQAFLDRGHHVLRIENDPRFADLPATRMADVMEDFLDDGDVEWDVILASPPCQAFSLGAGGTHIKMFGNCVTCGATAVKIHEKWARSCTDTHPLEVRNEELRPVSEFGRYSIALVDRTLDIVNTLQPEFWWMENPNGGMIHFVPESIPRVQVTYCRYGEDRMKLTNLWGTWPGTFDIDKKASKDKSVPIWANVSGDGWVPRPRCSNGDPCHETSRRGDKTGTQGIKGAAARALVPYELSMEVCLAVEAAL